MLNKLSAGALPKRVALSEFVCDSAVLSLKVSIYFF